MRDVHVYVPKVSIRSFFLYLFFNSTVCIFSDDGWIMMMMMVVAGFSKILWDWFIVGVHARSFKIIIRNFVCSFYILHIYVLSPSSSSSYKLSCLSNESFLYYFIIISYMNVYLGVLYKTHAFSVLEYKKRRFCFYFIPQVGPIIDLHTHNEYIRSTNHVSSFLFFIWCAMIYCMYVVVSFGGMGCMYARIL